MDPKVPEDIYKTHLEHARKKSLPSISVIYTCMCIIALKTFITLSCHCVFSLGFSTAQPVDSARANLSSSLVNGFVNCAFGVDKLLTEDGNKWIYKNKANGTYTLICFHKLVNIQVKLRREEQNTMQVKEV